VQPDLAFAVPGVQGKQNATLGDWATERTERHTTGLNACLEGESIANTVT
jgi:hypothetical protein